MKLKEEIKTSRYIFPICIPHAPESELEHEKRIGNTVTVTGFRTGDPSDDNYLHFIQPKIQSQSVCNATYGNIDESDVFAITARSNTLPDLFQQSVMCASDKIGNDCSIK